MLFHIREVHHQGERVWVARKGSCYAGIKWNGLTNGGWVAVREGVGQWQMGGGPRYKRERGLVWEWDRIEFGMMMEAARTSETSVGIDLTTRQHSQKTLNFILAAVRTWNLTHAFFLLCAHVLLLLLFLFMWGGDDDLLFIIKETSVVVSLCKETNRSC
jgi:hypothetical protein